MHVRWWERVGRDMLIHPERQCHIFGPFFESKIGLFVLSLQPHMSPDHSLHILTILTKLYRLIYGIPSHHRLSSTSTKSVKIEISLQGSIRRVSSQVYARCLRSSIVLISSLPFACIALWRYGGRQVLSPRDFCRG